MSIVDLDELHLQVMGVSGAVEEQTAILGEKLDHIIHLLQVLTNDKPVKGTKTPKLRSLAPLPETPR